MVISSELEPGGAGVLDGAAPSTPRLFEPHRDASSPNRNLAPITAELDADGRLQVGGCGLSSLARTYGTPLYVLDEASLRGTCRAYREALAAHYPGEALALYASKANSSLAISALVASEGLGLDAVSAGELLTALEGGMPADRIVFHGNNKSPRELNEALDAGVGRIVLDNDLEIVTLDAAAQARRHCQEVWIRVAPGVDPHTHRRIRTGQNDTKFGFNITSGAALEAVVKVLGRQGLLFTGLHAHVGSNLKDMEAHLAALDAVLDLALAIRDETGLSVEELNLGGGLGIRYLPSDVVPPVDEFAERLTSALLDGLASRHLPVPHLHLEPGRSIVGEAGTTLYTVGATKSVPIPEAPGHRAFVAIDGGMSDNPRPQLYDAVYSAMIANRPAAPTTGTYRVSGKHCETDTLIDDVALANPQAGDIIAVQSTGAYNHSMASNYNRLPRPAVVFVREGTARLVSRRETYEDLVHLDIGPDDDAGAPVNLPS